LDPDVSVREQREPVVEPICELLQSECGRTRRGKLNRKRNPIQAPHDRSDRGCRTIVQRKTRIDRLCPRKEKANCAVPPHLLASLGARRRHAKRRHPINVLAFHREWLAAGRQHVQRGRCTEQRFGDSRGRFYDVLTIVEHQQQALRAEHCSDTVGRHRGGLKA
jgi:hypothetical protein